jgi:repressor of nif and glnA expression
LDCDSFQSLLTVFDQLSALCCLRDTADLEYRANFDVVKKADVAVSLTRTADSQIERVFDVVQKTDVALSLTRTVLSSQIERESNLMLPRRPIMLLQVSHKNRILQNGTSSWLSFNPQRQFTH